MILGIGCDITEHALAEKLNWTTDKKFLKRVFSGSELKIYDNLKKLRFLTGRFAAKEAVLKCLGTGMYDGIFLKNIEILQNENGKPIVKLKGEVKKISSKQGIKNWFVSISHSRTCSMAYVVAEG